MQIIINIANIFSIYLLISISFSLIYNSIKFFHIVHAIVITFGAYSVFLFSNIYSFPLLFSILLAIALAASIGILCDTFIYRPMRRKNLPELAYLIVSLGLYIVLQNLISMYFGDDTKIIITSEVTVGHRFIGAYITTIQITTVIVSFVLFVGANLLFKYNKIGKSIRAVSSNPELCNIYGISSNKIILIAFGIGSALAAVAGILSAMDTNMTPTFGFNLLLYGMVAMIIGGVGSTKGLIAGALLVATAQNLAAYYIDSKWMDAITYIILIMFLIWKPLGFSGKRLKKVEV